MMFFALVAGLSFSVYLITSIIIFSTLKKQGVRINSWGSCVLIHKYAIQYNQIKKNGSRGVNSIYILFNTSFIMMILAALAAVIFNLV